MRGRFEEDFEQAPLVDEFVDLAKEYCNGDEKETIVFLVDILNAIRNNYKGFTDILDERIEEYAEQNNRCCCCGEELMLNTYSEQREYQGCNIEEPIYEKECPNCGYI